MSRTGPRVLLGAYLVLVLALTLTPLPLSVQPPLLVPFTGIRLAFENGGFIYGLVQVAANVLLLFPVGLLLPRAAPVLGGHWWRVALIAAALSVGIEAAQWLMHAGRQADVDDVWMNTLGAGLGWLVAWRAGKTSGEAIHG